MSTRALSLICSIALAGCEKPAEGDAAASNKGRGADSLAPAVTGAAAPCPPPECLASIDLTDTLNQTFTAASMKGKVVVINFWATWCKPCKREIPAFSRVYERYKDRGVLIFGVAQEDIATVDLLNFASDHEMSYPIILVDDLLARNYGLAGNIPTTFIYDKAGRRRTNSVGALEEHELEGILEKLLAE